MTETTAAVVGERRRLGRTTAAMTGWTAVSRLTGFVRILVVTAVLGTGALGDTYQTANTVPNILFELFAAGALQAVLVPVVVEILDRDGQASAERATGAVLGALSALLAAVAAVAMVAAPLVMRLLTASDVDAAVRDAKVELGTLFLWFFLPQLVFYGVGLVASAVLNASGRFLVPVAAPAVNNVIVIGVYGLFYVLRGGEEPSLDLTGAEEVLLGLGTTLAVVVFTGLPVLALARSGFRLRPRLERHPVLRRLARAGAWAGAFMALTQVLLIAVLVMANGADGGVVAFTFGLAFFLLPFALFATPVATARYPDLARAHLGGDHAEFSRSLASGTRATVVLLVPCAAALAALAWPIVRVVAFGAAGADDAGGLAPLAHTLVGFAPGVVGYGLVYLYTRAAYALGDTRSPTVANLIGVTVGVVAMIISASAAPVDERAAVLAACYGAAATVTAVVLGVVVGRRVPMTSTAGVIARVVGAGVVAALAMAIVASALDGQSRLAALGTLLAAGAVGVVVFAVAVRVVAGRSWRRLLADAS